MHSTLWLINTCRCCRYTSQYWPTHSPFSEFENTVLSRLPFFYFYHFTTIQSSWWWVCSDSCSHLRPSLQISNWARNATLQINRKMSRFWQTWAKIENIKQNKKFHFVPILFIYITKTWDVQMILMKTSQSGVSRQGSSHDFLTWAGTLDFNWFLIITSKCWSDTSWFVGWIVVIYFLVFIFFRHHCAGTASLLLCSDKILWHG